MGMVIDVLLLCCILVLTRGRYHVMLGVAVLAGCSSGTLPNGKLSMGTAGLPLSLFSSGGILFFNRLLWHAGDEVGLFSVPRHYWGLYVYIVYVVFAMYTRLGILYYYTFYYTTVVHCAHAVVLITLRLISVIQINSKNYALLCFSYFNCSIFW